MTDFDEIAHTHFAVTIADFRLFNLHKTELWMKQRNNVNGQQTPFVKLPLWLGVRQPFQQPNVHHFNLSIPLSQKIWYGTSLRPSKLLTQSNEGCQHHAGSPHLIGWFAQDNALLERKGET